MDVKLTPEQRDAIHLFGGQPVPFVDDATNERFFLIAEPAFLHLKSAADESVRRHEHLKQLIQEGLDSPSVPADEAFARIRAMAERAANSAQ